jgi:hypothetical protein
MRLLYLRQVDLHQRLVAVAQVVELRLEPRLGPLGDMGGN